MSTFVDPYTRLSLIAGTADQSNFQIPNVPGAPLNSAITPPVFGVGTFNSAQLNENQNEDTQFGVLALQRSVNGFDGQLSYFTRYDNLHFTPDPVGDSAAQRHRLGHQPSVLYQWRPGRRLLPDQPGTYACAWALLSAANKPGSTIHRSCRHAATAPLVAAIDHRRRRQARLARRRLCAGRVEDHRQADDELRRPLRPDVAICRCQSVKPARELHLQAVRQHHLPCRLCALFHAAGPGRSGAGQYRAVQRHDRRAGERRHEPGAAGALALFRCRRRSENSVRLLQFGAANDCTTLDLGIDAYYKIAKDLLDNGTFGQALVLSGVQLRQGHQ